MSTAAPAPAKRFRKDNAASVLGQLQGITAGLTAHGAPGGGDVLPVSGKTEAVPALVAELQGYQAAYEAVGEAYHAYELALEARDALAAQATARCCATRDALKGAAGKTSKALADYAIEPEKTPEPLTGEAIVARTAKAKITRAALGTLSPAEKKGLKAQLDALGAAAIAAHVAAKGAAPAAPLTAAASAAEPAGDPGGEPGGGASEPAQQRRKGERGFEDLHRGARGSGRGLLGVMPG